VKRRLPTVFASGVLAFALSGAAMAGTLEDGVAALQRGDYATAMGLLRPLAGQGDAAAQNNVGIMYRYGQGVAQDYGQALGWCRKAAEQGNASAQYNLGLMHTFGQGLPQGYTEAAELYRKAAEQGNASAQVNLGLMYENGLGVAQDYVLAHMWSNLAASRAADAETRDLATRNRGKAAAKMTPNQIAEAQKMAREWRPK
jgi:uncharacterized protein